MMNIAINGTTGFIGSNLSHYLSCIGHSVIPIGRAIYYDQHKLKQTLEGTNVVINLAGASINHRWSKSYQHEIYSSRVDVTRQLVKAINSLSHKPELLISASAVGFYDSQGIHNEYNHRQGKGFLPALCRDWEAEANQVSSDIRLVITRFGVVFSSNGGAFPQMVRSIPWGISFRIGNGHQIISWIALADLMRAMEFIISHPELDGIVNCTTPESITQGELAKAIANAYHIGIILSVPALLFKLLYGKASTVFTEGQHAKPVKLPEYGFSFISPNAEDFLQRTAPKKTKK